MDPKANLTQQLETAAAIMAAYDKDEVLAAETAWDLAERAAELAELVLALNEWRTKGGFDPYQTDTEGTAR